MKRKLQQRGVTLIELLTVVLIIGILATIATNVYVGQTLRARVAATRNTIRELSVGAVRYEIDTGELPLSGSGTVTTASGAIPVITSRTPPANLNSLAGRDGNGFLYLELVHSLSGQASAPYPNTWQGPYMEFQATVLRTSDDLGAQLPNAQVQILDSFGNPFEYVNFLEYDPAQPSLARHLGLTGLPAYTNGGTEMFNSNITPSPPGAPQLTNPELPAPNVFFATETYYNPRTFQIWSPGPDGLTAGSPYMGTQIEDISNFTF